MGLRCGVLPHALICIAQCATSGISTAHTERCTGCSYRGVEVMEELSFLFCFEKTMTLLKQIRAQTHVHVVTWRYDWAGQVLKLIKLSSCRNKLIVDLHLSVSISVCIFYDTHTQIRLRRELGKLLLAIQRGCRGPSRPGLCFAMNYLSHHLCSHCSPKSPPPYPFPLLQHTAKITIEKRVH